jgi:plastocyanin
MNSIQPSRHVVPAFRIWAPRAVLAFFVATLLAFATAAPLRRNLLNPLLMSYGTAQANVTRVIVRGDTLQGHVFDPAIIEVRVGDTVTWSFEDTGSGNQHNVVSINIVGEDFASPVLVTGTFSHTFDQPGTYVYDCTLHSNMRGKVVVTP